MQKLFLHSWRLCHARLTTQAIRVFRKLSMKGLLWKPSNVLLDRQTYLPPRFQSRCAICSAPTQSRPLVPHSSIPTFPKNSPSTSSNGRSLDVVALGNLCLDIMVPVETLPDAEVESRRALLKELTAATHDRNRWEVGGGSLLQILKLKVVFKMQFK